MIRGRKPGARAFKRSILFMFVPTFVPTAEPGGAGKEADLEFFYFLVERNSVCFKKYKDNIAEKFE